MKNSAQKKITIGLTGGIGSGKTSVARILEKLGIPIYYSDIRAKEIMLKTDIKNKIIKLLGEDSYLDNTLNKKYISQKIFNDKSILQKLNNIVHPEVLKDFNDWKNHQSSKIVIKENAILFESGSYKDCDFVITVTANIEKRLQRVTKRDNLSEEEILKKIQNQIPEKEKITKSNFVIFNNSDLDYLKSQTKILFDKLTNIS